MKIIAISGSPRNKNTNYMLKTILNSINEGCELVLLKNLKIEPCNACGGCYDSHECIINDDMKSIYNKLKKANIIILGSPTYFDNVTGIMKNFIDRCLPLYLSRSLKNKKAALVTVGNYTEGEEKKGSYNVDPKLEEKSVKNCLKTMENFCDALELNIIGKVFAIRSNPQSKQQELIELAKKMI